MKHEVPIWEKSNLTLEEAAAYSGIGINKLREISNEPGCSFVFFVGKNGCLSGVCWTNILRKQMPCKGRL